MDGDSRKQITVSFTKHQMQLLDRLMEQRDHWQSLNELILEAVHDFSERHAAQSEKETDA